MSQGSSQALNRIFVSRVGWYAFRYPEGWEIEEKGGFVAVYNPDGVGALHISAYQTPSPVNPQEEILNQFSHREPPVVEEDVVATVEGSKKVASLEQVVKHSFQKSWFISDNCYFVLVTYDCDEEDRDVELSRVEEIVKSIQIESTLSRN